MAEDEKKESEEKPVVKEEKKRNTKKIIIFLISIIILSGVAFLVWNFYLKKNVIISNTAETAKKEEVKKKRIIYNMKPFIVNLLGNQGKRYLKAKIDLEIESNEVIIELTERDSEIRDTILLLLAGKAFEDISKPEGKITLRNELIAKINDVLQKDSVKGLYFTEFVVQ